MAHIPSDLSNLLSDGLFETISLIGPDHLTDGERCAVPEWWVQAAESPDRAGLDRALAEWQSCMPDALVNWQDFLRTHGRGVFLGRSESENKPLLAYPAATPAGDTVCWYGFPPAPELHHPTLDLTALPADVRRLCTTLHDGFKLASAFHNGFPSSSEWFTVGQEFDNGDIEVVGSATTPDLDQLVALFFDFGASSVCAELGTVNAASGWVISDGQLQTTPNIWTTIDRWMLSLIEP